MTFEYVDHTADVAVLLRAADFEGLLDWATKALRDILVEDRSGDSQEAGSPVLVCLEAEDREGLLIDYLNELIFLFDTEGFVPAAPASVVLDLRDGCRLQTAVKGELFHPSRHQLKTEVKAATFHNLEIRATPAGLEAQVVFDL